MRSWAQWIAAFASSYTIVANILPFFLIMVLLITGVLIPYGTHPFEHTDNSSNYGVLEVYHVLHLTGNVSYRRCFVGGP
jgi:hypothetical protein